MKKTIFAVVILVLLSVGADAFAQSCLSVTGPHWWGSRSWYEYDITPSCYNTWNASATTSSCGNGAWSMGDSGSANYSFTVGSQVLNANNWQATTRVYFNDPNNSSANWVFFGVDVHHPNNTTTQYQFVSWSGTDGDITGCVVSSGTFSATTGDVVEVKVLSAAAVGTPTITVEYPQVFNNN